LLFVPLCILNTQHTCHACFVQHVVLYVASSSPLDLLPLCGWLWGCELDSTGSG
jgi:hypothetical protein